MQFASVKPIAGPDGLFPAGLFAVAWSEQWSDPSELFEQEQRLVEGAIAKRRLEFATGRVLARQALRDLDQEPAPILRDAAGAPLWGVDCIGSISHTEGLTAAVATRRRFARGVGVDVECRERPFPWGVIGTVAKPEERAWLDGVPEDFRDLAAFVLFSAKESAIKCLYSGGGPLVSFNDIAVRMDLRGGVFAAAPAAGFGEAPLAGRLGWNASHVFTGLWWPADDGTPDSWHSKEHL